nr:uncharacterized protein LOC113802191 [Penaeus vannamei]
MELTKAATLKPYKAIRGQKKQTIVKWLLLDRLGSLGDCEPRRECSSLPDRCSHYPARLACLPLNVSLIRELSLQYGPMSAQEWRHWLQTFKTFIAVLPQENLKSSDFSSILCRQRFMNFRVHYLRRRLNCIQSQFVKPSNEVFARHRLAARRQEPAIRQRLLENKTLDLATMYDQAWALDLAQKNSESYGGALSSRAVDVAHENTTNVSDLESVLAASATKAKCFFCCLLRHPCSKCPARDAVCHKCQKNGHFSKLCRSSSVSGSVTPNNGAMLATITSAATLSILLKAVTRVSINGIRADVLIDSGSSESFIHPDLVKHH